MPYRLSALAELDLDEIWSYVAEDASLATADQLVDPSGLASADRRHNLTIRKEGPLGAPAKSRVFRHLLSTQRLKEPLSSGDQSDGASADCFERGLGAGRDNFRDNNGDS